MSGWVKIHRKMLDSAFFNKPNYVSLWMCLLLSASHSRSTFIWNGEELTIESGQLLTGRKELSRKTGIAETTVERILNHFEKYGQIGQLKTSKYRLITIRKWGEYQIVDNKRTTNGQQTDTFKNVKKEKNISEPKVSGDIPLTDNQTTVGWKNKPSDNDDDLQVIDLDSRKVLETEESKQEKETKELNAKIRANLKTIEPLRGIPWGTGKDMNFHVKIYRDLLKSGHSHASVVSAFMDIVDTPHWKEKKSQGEYPGMNTVQFHLRNKKPL